MSLYEEKIIEFGTPIKKLWDNTNEKGKIQSNWELLFLYRLTKQIKSIIDLDWRIISLPASKPDQALTLLVYMRKVYFGLADN